MCTIYEGKGTFSNSLYAGYRRGRSNSLQYVPDKGMKGKLSFDLCREKERQVGSAKAIKCIKTDWGDCIKTGAYAISALGLAAHLRLLSL